MRRYSDSAAMRVIARSRFLLRSLGEVVVGEWVCRNGDLQYFITALFGVLRSSSGPPLLCTIIFRVLDIRDTDARYMG